MAVDKLVPQANATDTGAILNVNNFALIDETVASADGSINDTNANGITGNSADWTDLTNLGAGIDTLNSSTFRVRCRVVNPGSGDTATYRMRAVIGGSNYDITYTEADAGSGFIDKTATVSTSHTAGDFNGASVECEQTAFSQDMGPDGMNFDIDAFEIEVDYDPAAVTRRVFTIT